METFVAVFDASGLVLGDATRRHVGMDATYSVAPASEGPVHLRMALEAPWHVRWGVRRALKKRYRATIRNARRRGRRWEADVAYHDLSSILDHPFYSILVEHRDKGHAATFRFANGQCIVRIDFDPGTHSAEGLLEALQGRIRAAGLPSMARLVPPDHDPFGDG